MMYKYFLHLLIVTSVVTVIVAMNEKQQRLLNRRLLAQQNLRPVNPAALQNLIEKQLTAEAAARNQLRVAALQIDTSSFPVRTANALHRAFTGGNNESIDMGKSHRRHIVHLEKTMEMLHVPTPTCKRLIAEGFGPFIKCQTYIPCKARSPYRTADGSCNNLKNPTWGKASIPFRRWLQPDYADGMALPRGSGQLPSARLVSRVVHSDSGTSDESQKHTHMLMQWGQFLDHDITRTPTMLPGYGFPVSCCGISDFDLIFRPECFPIDIPRRDPNFNGNCMDFVRSEQVANANCKAAPVEQMNALTAYIDASQVYGSSQSEQKSLRAFKDGQLKQLGEFLPKDSDRTSCNTPSDPHYCFKAGDERVNENPTLQSMHTIFLREHNRIAAELKKLAGNRWNDEKLFQESRKIVGAIMQQVTYSEYLPAVLGPTEMAKYNLNVGSGFSYTNQYNPQNDASIKNVFATAAFRMGHSMIREMMSSLNKVYGSVVSDNLSDVFGDTNFIIRDPHRTLGRYVRGLLKDCAQSVDRKMTSEVTNNLFRDSSGQSLDLAALNIQRGRDHGLPGYIYWRQFCNVKPQVSTFAQLSKTHKQDAIKRLKRVYSNVKEIDLFPGALSEIPAPGSLLGPTFSCLLGKQFQDLKQGDRFWFEDNNPNVRFTNAQLQELRKATLSRVICDNTDTVNIQRNAFLKDTELCSCCDLPSVDLRKWVPGKWGPWSSWSKCKGGRKTRTRKCIFGYCTGPSTGFLGFQTRPSHSRR